ncbi:hypothetical protein [Treponema sp.]|uniref:hypothetical protein n=1 Tax=Treponema sp. TaxID=166 RepID=UPI00257B5D58|nr:hypothetical protein [Treponema sp.]MBE6353442.1 hypothetical protein [Treponema sp.]
MNIKNLMIPFTLQNKNKQVDFELAINAGAETIVTFNKKDFQEAETLGIKIKTPKEFLEEMEV